MPFEQKILQLSFVHFMEPDFPLNYILDIFNYIFLTTILCFIIKFKTNINNKTYLLFSLLMLTPFLMNGFIVNHTLFPDQSKYISASRVLRENLFIPENIYDFFITHPQKKESITAAIFNLFPSTNFETYRSIGFINRFIFLLMIIFLIEKKKLSLSVKLFVLLSPSLLLYSSISLREIIILVIMVFLFYSLLQKNFFSIILLTCLLFVLKTQNLLLVYLVFILQFLFDRKKSELIYSYIFIIFLASVSIFYSENIFLIINEKSVGFFVENYGSYKSQYAQEHFIELNLINILPETLKGMAKIILSPFPNLDNLFMFIIFFENLIIYLIIYFNFIHGFNKKHTFEKKITIYWLCNILISMALYSYISFNDGTIHRYKIVIFSYVLIAYNLHLANRRKIELN